MVSVLPESLSLRGIVYWLGTGMIMISAYVITNQLVGKEIQTAISKKE